MALFQVVFIIEEFVTSASEIARTDVFLHERQAVNGRLKECCYFLVDSY